MKRYLEYVLIIFCFEIYPAIVFSQDMTDEYFRQTPPGNIPIVFAPGIISSSDREHSAPSFSPDKKEVYWSVIRKSNDSIYQHIMCIEFIDGAWNKPHRASFSDINCYEGGPVVSADGNKLYIYRGKAAPPGGDADSISIFCYTRKDNEWINPMNLGEGASHSVARNGTIYYTGKSGITRKVFKNKCYGKPEILGSGINAPGTVDWTPFIAPDESYLIFSRVDEGGDYGNLFIAFHDTVKDIWKEPVDLGPPINTWPQERFPTINPDGKYLFFTRWISDSNDDVFWVSSCFIETLRKAMVK